MRPPSPEIRLARLRAWCPVPLPDPTWRGIRDAYTGPGRHYHTLEHLCELAGSYEAVAAGPGWRDPRAVALAVLFHDVVQARVGPPGQDEARSAELLAGCGAELGLATDGAERLIRLTGGHGAAGSEPLDHDAALFLDCDLAILGAPPARFARYERDVAREYAPIHPPELYAFGRRAFLTALLERPIFHTAWFRDRLERQARRNVQRALR